MKTTLILFIIPFLFLVGCKTKSIEINKTNTVVEYYKNGNIKSVGNVYDFPKENYDFRTGLWSTFYENGKLKESGNYKLATYVECSVGGHVNGYYSYKFGEWIYFHENGNLKAKGIYKIGTKNIKTSCEGGDNINYGLVDNSWEFYDSNGNKINPTQSDIDKIQESSYISEWDMRKK
ncbi:hypothetical protein ACFPVY_07290 [Flavobacterium qiangtangense]|uniref:MORN repeat protein n=1 Tax=Flavobacterium qiangtangense TaxID=1442595 RepID=A0ABW1PLE2_9FLAO